MHEEFSGEFIRRYGCDLHTRRESERERDRYIRQFKNGGVNSVR